MIKIAFLALDDIHHVHHIAPIAFELSRNQHYQCVVYLQAHCLPLVNKIAENYPQHRCSLQIVSPTIWRRVLRFWRQGIYPARRLIQQYTQDLLTYDALITPDLNCAYLLKQSQGRAKRPLFFLTFHGGGSRERPYHLMTSYDFVLLCGERRRREFAQAGYLTEKNFAVTGYPKFDLIAADFQPKLFDNDKPVVLYNPHFDLTISSWTQWGLAILEHFYQSKSFNLIFSPHCNLFRRHLSVKQLPKKYFTASNIIVDLGSEKAVDMTYTQAADIYLGDVSSQVCEFIRRPRPCFFLNPRQFNEKDYPVWSIGTVIDNFQDLAKQLAKWPVDNPHQLQQTHYFAQTFSVTEQLAAARAAAAIGNKLGV